MKISFITDEVTQSFDEAVRFARQNGLAGLELRSVEDTAVDMLPAETLRTWRRRLDAEGLTVCGLAGSFYKCAPEPDAVEAELAKLERLCAAADILGCAFIRGFAFFAPEEGPLPAETLAPYFERPVRLLEQRGKTLLLAEEMQGQGALYSCDVAEHRVELIRSAVERMGFAHVTALCNDATRPNPKLPAADRILVDAPCSGLGILAKKPDIRYKTLGKARHDELLATQSSILDTAAALLKAGGRLVYSTCTIDPAENEEQVAAFLARHPEFRVVRPAVAFPDGMTVGEHGALSVSTRTGMDGFFLCAMQKTQ